MAVMLLLGLFGAWVAGLSEAYLIKTDNRGRKLWSQTFWQGDVNYGKAVQQTLDQGYIVAGKKEHVSADDEDIYLIKTYGDGIKAWSMTSKEWGSFL